MSATPSLSLNIVLKASMALPTLFSNAWLAAFLANSDEPSTSPAYDIHRPDHSKILSSLPSGHSNPIMFSRYETSPGNMIAMSSPPVHDHDHSATICPDAWTLPASVSA